LTDTQLKEQALLKIISKQASYVFEVEQFLLDDDVLRWTKKNTLETTVSSNILKKVSSNSSLFSHDARFTTLREGEACEHATEREPKTTTKKKC
jgi:hypothetical protein